jgi:glutathione S-transferase
MKLYWGPHTCAIGTHILLEEIGAPYETVRLDVSGGETEGPQFKSINPKGKVPTLVRDDGSVVTEFGAIATWLARQYPEAHLIPESAEGEARMVEILEYVTGTVHGQGYGRIFKPAKFEPQDVLHAKVGLGRSSVETQGRAMVDAGFKILDAQLAGRAFASGSSLSIADAALFYVERWAPLTDIQLPMHVQAHFERMLARPSVQKVRKIWGEA